MGKGRLPGQVVQRDMDHVLHSRRKKLGILPLEKRLMLDASLPVTAGQVLWLDASDDTTILDADGDDAASGTGGNNDGFDGSVATWQDKSSSGFDVTAAGTERPQYGVDTQNGNGVITFDGSNDRLTSNDTITGDDVTMFIVYNRTASTTREAVFELGLNSTSRNGVFLYNNDTVNYYSTGPFSPTGNSYAVGNYYLASFIHDGANIDGWMNGVQDISTTTNARTDTTNITVGDDVTSGDEMTGTVAEIIVYDRDLSADERHDVENYLANKWGLTIANAAPTVDTNGGITLDEGTALGITNAELASSDTDNTDGSLIYTITDAADNGTLTNTNTSLTLGLNDTFTQSDIDNGYITYTHDGSATTADAFGFSMTDQYDSVAGQTFSITINPVGTEADVYNIDDPVLHFDATDIDNDGDTSDQPADGDQVNTWVDDAGASADNASETGNDTPVYDDDAFNAGVGGVRFDGVNDRLRMGTDNEVNNSTYPEKSFAMTFRTGNDVSSDQLVYEQGGTTNGINFGIFNGDIYAYTYRGGSGGTHYAINLGAAEANTTYQLIAIYDNVTTNTWSANLNGGAFSSMAVNSDIPSHSGAPALGNENGNTLHPVTNGGVGNLEFDGAIGEFWSWNHVLTAAEVADVSDYLTDKWFSAPPTETTNATLDVPQDALATIQGADLEYTDPEGDPATAITYTLTGLPANGTLYNSGVALGLGDSFTQDDLNNNLITYDHDGTPPPGSDSFDFTVSDGYGSTTSTQSFDFNIITPPPADPYVSANTLTTIDEGATFMLTAAELETSDPDTADNALTYTVTAATSQGTLFLDGVALGIGDTFTQQDIVDGDVTYTHNDSENFTDSFEFTVTDGTTVLPNAVFNFDITPVNDQTPTDITLSSTSINETASNGTVIGTLGAVDADLPGDSFTYSIIADPDNKFNIVGNELRKNGNLNFENANSHSVTIRVNDGVNTYDEVFTINVNDVNEDPTDIALTNNSIVENSAIGTVIGNLSGTDEDLPGDTLSFSIVSDPDSKFQIAGNQLQVGGALDLETSATHNVTIRVSDGNGGSYDEVFTINVTGTNDAPVVTTDSVSLAQGNTLTLTTAVLSATDQDDADAGLVYEMTALPSDGTLRLGGAVLGVGDTFTQQDIIDANLVYHHDNLSTGASDNFSFTVTDGINVTAPDTFTLNLTVSLNTNEVVSVTEGGSVQITNADLSYSAGQSDWYDNDWSYRQIITVDAAQIDSDLTDFSLLITENGMTADFWNNVKADGSDIVITDSAGNKLDRELVTIDTGGQAMQLFTRADLSSTMDTELYIYYGNAGAAETNSATTWRSEYTGVWHFDDDFNDGDAADSSQAGNHGFTRNGFGNGNQAGGVIGNAAQFNDNEYLAMDYGYTGNNSLPEISVSAWINTTDNSGGQNNNWAIIDFDRSEFFNVFIHGNGEVGFSTAGNGIGTNDQLSGVTVNDGNWHHVAAVYDGTDKILYVDGAEVDRVNNVYGGTALGKGTRYGFIGDGSEAGSFDAGRNNSYYDGLFDNIRMYEGTMSEAWITAEYRNQSDTANFYSVGGQETLVLSAQYTITGTGTNGTFYLDADMDGKFTSLEALTLGSTFTQDDIDAGQLYYLHDDSNTLSDQMLFTVDNGNGDVSAVQTFRMNIIAVNDSPFVPPEPQDTGGSDDGGVPGPVQEELRRTEGIVMSSLSGNDANLNNAYYGLGGFQQILRENTTFIIRDITDAPETAEQANVNEQTVQPQIDVDTALEIENSDETGNEERSLDLESAGERFTNLRETLALLEKFDQEDNQAGDADNEERAPAMNGIQKRFHDVLTYHEQKQARLRDALQ